MAWPAIAATARATLAILVGLVVPGVVVAAATYVAVAVIGREGGGAMASLGRMFAEVAVGAVVSACAPAS